MSNTPMSTEMKLRTLERVLKKAQTLTYDTRMTAEFHSWLDAVYLAIDKVYGNDTHEMQAFNILDFGRGNATQRTEATERHDQYQFTRDMKVVIAALENYVAEQNDELEIANKHAVVATQEPAKVKGTKKVFISHASADKAIVGELIQLLKLMGLKHDQIFCTSFPEYGIPLGANYLDWLRAEITDNALVLFVLSKNFYDSPVCLSEMGATWALAKNHVPLLVPPFKYDDVKGVFPQSQGMFINEKHKYNELAKLVDKQFGFNAGRVGDWERGRDEILARIDDHIVTALRAVVARIEAEQKGAAQPFLELQAILDDAKAKMASHNK